MQPNELITDHVMTEKYIRQHLISENYKVLRVLFVIKLPK